MDLIFFGIQGSGKGTQSKIIAERYDMQVFETGGELRKLAQENSELGGKVKSIIEAGHLVSNEVVMEIVENFMNNLENDKAVLFDGIPRKVEQAQSLNKLLKTRNRPYKAVFIDLGEKSALNRLTTRRICQKCKEVYPEAYSEERCEKCNGELVTRKDDNPKAIKTRLEAFTKETLPALKLYQDNLIKVDGEPPIETVSLLLFEQLDPIMRN